MTISPRLWHQPFGRKNARSLVVSIDIDEYFVFPAIYTPPLLLAKALEHNPIASLAPSSLQKGGKTCATVPSDQAYMRRRRMRQGLRITVCTVFTAAS
jgi:hypothetical protein